LKAYESDGRVSLFTVWFAGLSLSYPFFFPSLAWFLRDSLPWLSADPQNQCLVFLIHISINLPGDNNATMHLDLCKYITHSMDKYDNEHIHAPVNHPIRFLKIWMFYQTSRIGFRVFPFFFKPSPLV
jgi:hypothetical protein